jgi:hypothetical protein
VPDLPPPRSDNDTHPTLRLFVELLLALVIVILIVIVIDTSSAIAITITITSASRSVDAILGVSN